MPSMHDLQRLAALVRGLPDPYNITDIEGVRRALLAIYECLQPPPEPAATPPETLIEGRNGIRALAMGENHWLVEPEPGHQPEPVVQPVIQRGEAPEMQPGYPWGAEWPWGFEWRGDRFRIWAPLVKARSSVEYLANFFEVEPPAEQPWGVRIKLDWSASPPFGAEEELVTDNTVGAVVTELLRPPDDLGNYPDQEWIPVCLFEGRKLLQDYVHGLYLPQVWVAT